MDIIEQALSFESKKHDTTENLGSEFLKQLLLALTIPSFCSKYIFTKQESKKYDEAESKRYVQWCDEYIDCCVFNSKEIYALRCSLLHHGDDDLENQRILKECEDNLYDLIIPFIKKTSSEVNENRTTCKSGCSNAIILNLLYAYRKFKSEFPDFKYPLICVND